MWRCETCGKLNSTGADRCHGCDDRAPAPEEDSQDSPKDLEGSISAWSGSGALSDDVLDDPEKLKEVWEKGYFENVVKFMEFNEKDKSYKYTEYNPTLKRVNQNKDV